MPAGPQDDTPEYLSERVAALETMLTELLPMLIQDAPYESDIRETLVEWESSPPAGMQGNPAFVEAVGQLLDHLPSA